MCYKVAAGGETGIAFSWTTAALAFLGVEEWSNTTIPATANSVSFALLGMGGGVGAISAAPAGWTHEFTDTGLGNKGAIVSSRVYTSAPGSAPSIAETWTTAQRVGTVIASFKGT